jgi:hypothetical protein
MRLIALVIVGYFRLPQVFDVDHLIRGYDERRRGGKRSTGTPSCTGVLSIEVYGCGALFAESREWWTVSSRGKEAVLHVIERIVAPPGVGGCSGATWS